MRIGSKGVLSLRTPINLEGSFSDVHVSPDKKPLLARASGALALAAVSLLAALIPLIETGPGRRHAVRPCAGSGGAEGASRGALNSSAERHGEWSSG